MNRLETLGLSFAISAGVFGVFWIGEKIYESHQEYKERKKKEEREKKAFEDYKKATLEAHYPQIAIMDAVDTFSRRDGVDCDDLTKIVKILNVYEQKMYSANKRTLFDAYSEKFNTLCRYLIDNKYTIQSVNAIFDDEYTALTAKAAKIKADEEHRRQMDIQRCQRETEKMRAEIISDAIKSLKSDTNVNITNLLEGGEHNE